MLYWVLAIIRPDEFSWNKYCVKYLKKSLTSHLYLFSSNALAADLSFWLLLGLSELLSPVPCASLAPRCIQAEFAAWEYCSGDEVSVSAPLWLKPTP